MTTNKTKPQEQANPPLLIASVSNGITTLSGILNNITSSSVTNKTSGWFSDNYRTFYVDENGKKHLR